MQKKEPKNRQKTDPKPPLPLCCFDPDTRKSCQYEQIDYTACAQFPPRAFCLWYKRKLKMNGNGDTIRCKQCLKEQNCVKWLTFSEAIPSLLKGKVLQHKHQTKRFLRYLNKCRLVECDQNGDVCFNYLGWSIFQYLTKQDLIDQVWKEVNTVDDLNKANDIDENEWDETDWEEFVNQEDFNNED